MDGIRPNKSGKPFMLDGGFSKNSRFVGTDLNGDVYIIGNTSHSNKHKYDEGYEQIQWNKEGENENESDG